MVRPTTYPMVVGLRLRAEDLDRLDALCKRTHRPRADLMRLLISQAELTGLPGCSSCSMMQRHPTR